MKVELFAYGPDAVLQVSDAHGSASTILPRERYGFFLAQFRVLPVFQAVPDMVKAPIELVASPVKSEDDGV